MMSSTYRTKPLPEYKASHTHAQLYRRTGASHTGMMSTGLSLYLSTRPAIPMYNCTGEQKQAIQECL
jgi:hypothetical protein